jgi:vesicular inhibitory amino acid transporter
MRLDAIKHAGGVNSIDNFARSWQRAAGFVEIRTSRPSFALSQDAEGEHEYERRDEAHGPHERRSLLRAQLQSEDSPDMAIETGDEDASGNEADDEALGEPSFKRRVSSPHEATSQRARLAPPFDPEFGNSYGSISSRVNESSMRHANQLWREQQLGGVQEPDKEREPLFVKTVQREDGKLVNVVVGRSTLPQTVFNSVNVLIGIGLLSLPLGFKYAGWLVSMIFLIFAAVTTSYTAKILAKCLEVDGTLITFADVAYISFGPRARIFTSILFVIELFAACVALVVLFADSLDALIPGLGVVEWKLICGLVLIPINFVPLRVLSFSSILGILCTISSKIES